MIKCNINLANVKIKKKKNEINKKERGWIKMNVHTYVT